MSLVPITPISSLTPLLQLEKTTQESAVAGLPFADVLKDAIANVQETQAVSKQDSMDLAMGRTDDLHTMQIHSMKSEAAISLASALTSKVINAYNEIARMQI